ncbi:MAG: hypothetical protein JNM81_15795 [Rhodospirillaceae bacterium]|nr:hypothetical protein [Rhodospirillaceae bacterium]
MTNTVETMMGMAKDRPDPKAVSQWLVAFLGKRPLEAKKALLNTFETEIAHKYSGPSDVRAATLVTKTIQKVRDGLR